MLFFFFFFAKVKKRRKKKSERQAASKSFFSESLCALSFSLVLLRSRRRRGPEAEARERPSAPPRWPLSSPERGGEGSRYVPLRCCCCCFFWDSRCWWPLRDGRGAGEALACSRRRRCRRIPRRLLRLLLRCSSARALSTCVPGGASWPRASGKESRPYETQEQGWKNSFAKCRLSLSLLLTSTEETKKKPKKSNKKTATLSAAGSSPRPRLRPRLQHQPTTSQKQQ